MPDLALNTAEVGRVVASQRTPLLPISAARMLNNYNDKMPRANPEPNTIAPLLKGGKGEGPPSKGGGSFAQHTRGEIIVR
jgi:hypothetical protein